MNRLNQTGIMSLWVVALVIAGIAAGTLLVQNGGNFIPRAAEQEELHPSAGATKNCANEDDKQQCQTDNDKICAADTVTYCDNRGGKPQAIRKSGGYYDPSNANQDPASGCVFDYRDVENKDSECGKTESKSGDVVYTTKEEAQKLDSDRNSTESNRTSQSSGSSTSTPTSAVCKEDKPGDTTKAFKDEKVSGNLVRFYAILAGVPEYCVPVDLGVEPKQTAKSVDGQEGRLMLCSDKDGGLVWRVIVGDQLVKSNKEPAPQKETLEEGFKDNINNAKTAAGISNTSTSCPGGVCP